MQSIQQYMTARRLTSRQLARQAGISHETLRKVMIGECRPSLRTVELIYAATAGHVWLAPKPKLDGKP